MYLLVLLVLLVLLILLVLLVLLILLVLLVLRVLLVLLVVLVRRLLLALAHVLVLVLVLVLGTRLLGTSQCGSPLKGRIRICQPASQSHCRSLRQSFLPTFLPSALRVRKRFQEVVGLEDWMMDASQELQVVRHPAFA